MRKRKSIGFILLLSFIISTLASCGTPRQQTEPREFSPDVLEWGMSQQEVLDTFKLSQEDVRTETIDIPSSENQAARTLTKMSFDNFVFEGLPFRTTFTFTEYHAECEWDLGLTKMYLDILEDSVNPFANLKIAFDQSHLKTSIEWEDLSRQEREKMHEFHKSVFPDTPMELVELITISAVGGEDLPPEDAEDIYYAYSISTLDLSVWNRYAKGTE